MEDTYKVESYTECYIEVYQLHNLGVFQASYRRHTPPPYLMNLVELNS